MKKLICLLLVLVMVLGLAACKQSGSKETTPSTSGGDNTEPSGTEGKDPEGYKGPDWDAIADMDYEEMSDYLYELTLGEFAEYYAVAKKELDNTDLRMALMALAEAKMLESGVFMPIYGDGGNYAMTRVVPRSGTTTYWGLDEYRFYTYLVTNELITSEHRAALVELWNEAANADEWFATAKTWLADNGYTLNDTYNALSTYDMETWDVIATSMTSDSFFLAMTYSGLLEYDAKNVLQPAMAESYEVSEDGKVYTFHLRKGVQWVDQQGTPIGQEVTAHDWVTSMMHLIDNADELGYLMSSDGGAGIKNFDAYLEGDITDFAEVGVKAIDDYTLEYTLEEKFKPFDTMMGYGCFAPLNYEFYKSQGGTFSAEGDEYTAGNYGTGPSTIAYCGPFLCTNYTEQNIWTFKANDNYWDKDAMNIHTINFYYNDGSDVMRAYNEAKANTVAGAGLNANALVQAKTEKPEGADKTYFDLYSYVVTNSATTYCAWLNVNRATFHDFNDETCGISWKADKVEEQERTRSAMNNQHFRLALDFAFDRGAYNAVVVGEDLKYNSLKNSYVPGDFLALQSEVTVEINGTSKTYPVGTFYGEIMQDQLNADGYPIQVWDPNGNDGAGSGDGFDGWYDVNNARAELELAIAELAQIGVEISAENPIHIDAFYLSTNENNTKSKQAYKQIIEESLEGKVIVDLTEYTDNRQMTYAYYRNPTGAEANFDISHNSGWGPDYGDVQTYLDTMQMWGYMLKNIGIY